jgi:hypothetical protein
MRGLVAFVGGGPAAGGRTEPGRAAGAGGDEFLAAVLASARHGIHGRGVNKDVRPLPDGRQRAGDYPSAHRLDTLPQPGGSFGNRQLCFGWHGAHCPLSLRERQAEKMTIASRHKVHYPTFMLGQKNIDFDELRLKNPYVKFNSIHSENKWRAFGGRAEEYLVYAKGGCHENHSG